MLTKFRASYQEYLNDVIINRKRKITDHFFHKIAIGPCVFVTLIICLDLKMYKTIILCFALATIVKAADDCSAAQSVVGWNTCYAIENARGCNEFPINNKVSSPVENKVNDLVPHY